MSAHALLIGVTRFSDPQLFGLRAPKSDVEALKDVLADPTRGGFDEVVTSIDEDLLAIRDKVSALLEGRRPSDLVLLYYSGHGIVDKGNNLFLATGETRAEKPRARSLPSSEVREMMEQSRAGRLVVVLDCCHSGTFTEGAKGRAAPVNEATFYPGEGAEGHYVLTATNGLQYALDYESAGPDDIESQPALSRFTSWLVDGLGRGEAAPNKSFITLDDLYAYLCRRARQSGATMTPQRYVKRNSGELIIARNPSAQPPNIPADLMARLDCGEWKARFDAVAELKDLVSKREILRGAARKALRDRMSNERDRDVHEALMACLVELGHKPETIPSHPRKVEAWEARLLSWNHLHVESLSKEDVLDLPRSARAWRNANWMFRSSLVATGLIVVGTIYVLVGAFPKLAVTWFQSVTLVAGLAALLSLSLLAHPADTLLSGYVVVLRARRIDFERTLYTRACWILLLVCVTAGVATYVRSSENSGTLLQSISAHKAASSVMPASSVVLASTPLRVPPIASTATAVPTVSAKQGASPHDVARRANAAPAATVASNAMSRQSGGAVPSSEEQPEVTILYLDKSRLNEANQIEILLKQNPGYDVSVEPYSAVAWSFTNPIELHYFRRNDETEAQKIVQALQNNKFDVKARYMPVSQDIPARYFEVWLQAR